MTVKTCPSWHRIEHIGGEHPGAQGHRDSARSLDPFAARGRRPRVRGGWRPEAAIGGVGSAENATGGATGPLSIACAAHRHAGAQTSRRSARSLDPFAARGRRPRVRSGWRPGALRRHLVGSACGAESYSSALGPDPSAELCNAGIQTQED